MKARILAEFACGKCGMAMWSDKDHIRCINPDCSDCDKRYCVPEVQLREVVCPPTK